MGDSTITHHIVDRPRLLLAHESLSKREFIQPQWILDCANHQFVLPLTRYAIGATLPPHLSPWDAGEYKPKYALELERLKAGLPLEGEEEADNENVVMEEANDTTKNAVGNDDTEHVSADDSSESDAESDSSKTKEKLEKRRKKEAEEAHRLAKTMMSRKASHLYGRMQHGIAKKKAEVDALHEKRKLLDEKEIIKGKEKDDSGKTPLKKKVERLKNERKKVEGKYNETGGSMKKGKKRRNK